MRSLNKLSFHQGFSKVGGMDGLWEKYGSAIGQSITATTVAPTTVASNFTTVAAALSTVTSTASNHSSNQTVDSCFKLTPYWGNLVRPLDDPDYPWLGLWTSLFITSVWYFCTDQVKCEKKSNFIYWVYWVLNCDARALWVWINMEMEVNVLGSRCSVQNGNPKSSCASVYKGGSSLLSVSDWIRCIVVTVVVF